MRYLIVGLCFLSPIAHAADLSGRVVSIADGDTVTLLDSNNQQHKIRLSGIDAPEKVQPFGRQSRSNLSALIFNRTVTAKCGKTDRYRQEICKILIDGADVNLEQVKAGMAWWYKQDAREQSLQDRENYEVAEFNAKVRRRGLWSEKNPLPPWEWRMK